MALHTVRGGPCVASRMVRREDHLWQGGTKYGATDGPRGTIRGAIYGPGGSSVLPRTVRGDSI